MRYMSEDIYEEFIRKYYYKELLEASKKDGVLKIDFQDIEQFDTSFADNLLENPKEVIKELENTAENIDFPTETIIGKKVKIKIRLFNLPKDKEIRIRDIRSEHLGKLVVFDGLIKRASDVRPMTTSITFECPACGALIEVEQSKQKLTEPIRCACGRKGKFKIHSKKLVDVQYITVEEKPESMEGGEQPKKINVFLTEDLVSPLIEKKINPGSKVKIIGIIKEIPVFLKSGGQSTRFDLIVEANNIIPLKQDYTDIKISKEDEEKIKQLAKNPRIFELLKNSIAPAIYGADKIKESIVLQMFGGVSKERADGTRTRGDIHILLVGDPGTGKSEILKYTAMLSPKSIYVSGKGASGAGLTATVVRDELLGGWSLEAGALVLANKGLAVIDELDKMSKEDRAAMHEALEQQTVTIAKAAIHATLKAETTLLAAANPKMGRFDPFKPIAQQIDLPPTLINRFDLIFSVRDIPNKKTDELIAEHVLKSHKNPEANVPEIEKDLLRKYIAYAKQYVFPKLTDEAISEIKKYYVNLRNKKVKGEEEGALKPIPISPRQLGALIRLSEASARARLREKVTKKDVKKAIELMEYCLTQVGKDPETGEFDIDMISVGISTKQRNRILQIGKIIEELAERSENGEVLEEVVIEEAKKRGIDMDKTIQVLEKMKREGEIFSPKTGIIKKVGR